MFLDTPYTNRRVHVGARAGELVSTLTACDRTPPGSGCSSAGVRYRLTGTDSRFFFIDSNTGQVDPEQEPRVVLCFAIGIPKVRPEQQLYHDSVNPRADPKCGEKVDPHE